MCLLCVALGIKLWESGDLQKYNVKVLGTPIDVIVATEDREIFSDKLKEIDETLALSYPGTSICTPSSRSPHL